MNSRNRAFVTSFPGSVPGAAVPGVAGWHRAGAENATGSYAESAHFVDMYARPEKYSVTIRGHRTSVSLEAGFWTDLGEIARERGISRNALITEIDAARRMKSGLASAIRVYVLEWHRRRSRRSGAADSCG